MIFSDEYNLMEVSIIATRGCNHRASLERQLQNLGVDYDLLFVEENPELVEELDIHHSPNLLVNGEVVCRNLPTAGELIQLLTLD